MKLSNFLTIDAKDISNWIGLLIAIPLLWWGIKTIISIAAG